MFHESWWTGIPQIAPRCQSKEYLGYPTQKPIVHCLERIIRASSKPGDIVLDPFCGCGTAVDAALRLKRQFVGIDISSFAIDLIIDRRLKDRSISTYGIPSDFASATKLAREKPFDFESWAVTRIPGFAPNTRQRADGGVDGRATLADKPSDFDSKLALAQVKGGDSFSLSALRDFIGVTERDNAALGCYVTLEPIDFTTGPYGSGKFWQDNGQRISRIDACSCGLSATTSMTACPICPSWRIPFTGKPLSQGRMF